VIIGHDGEPRCAWARATPTSAATTCECGARALEVDDFAGESELTEVAAGTLCPSSVADAAGLQRIEARRVRGIDDDLAVEEMRLLRDHPLASRSSHSASTIASTAAIASPTDVARAFGPSSSPSAFASSFAATTTDSPPAENGRSAHYGTPIGSRSVTFLEVAKRNRRFVRCRPRTTRGDSSSENAVQAGAMPT